MSDLPVVRDVTLSVVENLAEYSINRFENVPFIKATSTIINRIVIILKLLCIFVLDLNMVNSHIPKIKTTEIIKLFDTEVIPKAISAITNPTITTDFKRVRLDIRSTHPKAVDTCDAK